MMRRNTRRKRSISIPKVAVTALIATFIVVILLFDIVHAESAKIQLEILPTTVELPSNQEYAKVLVVIRNSLTNKIQQVQLSWFTNTSSISIKNTGAQKIESVSPQGELSWLLELSKPQKESVSGNVYLRVDYLLIVENASPIAQVALASFKVTSQEFQPTDQIASVQVSTTLESLNQQRPGKAYLVVTNKSSNLLNSELVSSLGPEFIEFEVSKRELVLEPQQTDTIPINIKAKDRVQPGKHLLLFNILLEWENEGHEHSRTIVINKEVNVGVLGESEILTLLGIPSFLLLPGFLIITTIGLLWNSGFLRLKGDTENFPLQINTPEFWLVSITLSGLVAIAYILAGNNYLYSYGLVDVVNVWIFSVVFVGFGSYLVFMYGRNKYLCLRTPNEDDEPIDILKKLGRRKLGVFLERVTLESQGDKKYVFLLESPDQVKNKETVWVSPSIKIIWFESKASKQESTKTQLEQLQREVEQKLRQKTSASTLAQILEEGLRLEILQLRWKPINQIGGPQEVFTKNLDNDPKADFVPRADFIIDAEQEYL